jgi:hypothetical protein
MTAILCMVTIYVYSPVCIRFMGGSDVLDEYSGSMADPLASAVWAVKQ